ncbi:MAG: DUF6252 family protein [Flavobacterium sp.]
MKKHFYFLSFLFLLSSCTEDVKFNNPAFQTLKDNIFWRAESYKVYILSNGSISIEGSLGFEKVNLQTASPLEKTYFLGVDDISKASYSNTIASQVTEFSTGANLGNGQIVITDYDIENNTISGTFKFKAVNSDKKNTENPEINFTEGVFYKVPIESAQAE